ncbi:MAG: zf-HC2 domain-containing protein [Aureliella sp.]
MNCTEIQDLLSPYYDGELSADARASVAEHLLHCATCAGILAGYRKLSDSISATPVGPVSETIWAGIVRELDRASELAAQSKVLTSATQMQRPWLTRATFQRLAIAASILLVFGLSVWLRRHDAMTDMHSSHGPEFVATMNHYLKVLPENPEQAEQFLLDKYDGKLVTPEQAISLVGYRPSVADGLPEGYTLASTSVLKMPCCTCVKAVCKRSDGSTLVLFEHDDEKTAWFGDRPTTMAMCGDKECCLVDLDSSIAATWREGTRSVTAVGARDQAEVVKFVDWFERS